MKESVDKLVTTGVWQVCAWKYKFPSSGTVRAGAEQSGIGAWLTEQLDPVIGSSLPDRLIVATWPPNITVILRASDGGRMTLICPRMTSPLELISWLA